MIFFAQIISRAPSFRDFEKYNNVSLCDFSDCDFAVLRWLIEQNPIETHARRRWKIPILDDVVLYY